jgi:hypothetical protein
LAAEAKALKAGARDFSFQGAFLANESKDGALKISSREELQSWLESLPPKQRRWVAVAIAARAVLRVAPLFALSRPQANDTEGKRWFENLTFAAFFAVASAHVAARFAIRVNELAAADIFASAFTAAEKSTTAYAVYAAASAAADAAASANVKAVYAAVNVAASTVRAVDGADALWLTVSRDADFIASGGTAQALARKPLWPDGEHHWVMQHWKQLQDALPRENDWQVWIDWYERRLMGLSDSEEVELVFTTVPNQERDVGPAAANKWIAERLREWLDTRRRPPPWDFFISYDSKKDTPYARFIDDVLRKAGYQVFVQFRDMPVGSDFVHEMQRGLQGSPRFAAVLSPRYVASDFCRAEWNAAFRDDPLGEKRKIVAFLIEQTDLAPLAGKTVHQSLIGLSRKDAAKAILAAIGDNRTVSPTARWPGAATLDAMTRATRDVYNLAPDAKNRLAPIRAKAGDAKKTHGFSAEELYANMRRAFAEIADNVCDPGEEKRIGRQFHFSDRLKKHAKMLRDAAPKNFDVVNALTVNQALVGLLRALEHDASEGLLPSGEMIAHYRSDLAGYYKQLGNLFPALKKYRKQYAHERFVPPSSAARQGLDEILSKAPEDPKVVSKALANDLRKDKEAIDAADELSAKASPEDAKADLVEPHMSAAAQITQLWNWIANPADKFAKSGKSAKEVADAIENYEKLYGALAKGKDYIEWLLTWFF